MKSHWFSGVVLAAGMVFAGAAHGRSYDRRRRSADRPERRLRRAASEGRAAGADDINAAGGVLGQNIALTFGDDVSDPKQGVSVANKFVGDGVKFVDGHFNSGVSIPASEVYVENGVLEITPAATNPVFTERGLWNIFRTCGRDDQQGAVAGAWIADNMKDAKVAVIHDKTPYGQGLADETKKAMNAAGLTEVMYEGVNTGDNDFSALISKMKEAGRQRRSTSAVCTPKPARSSVSRLTPGWRLSSSRATASSRPSSPRSPAPPPRAC